MQGELGKFNLQNLAFILIPYLNIEGDEATQVHSLYEANGAGWTPEHFMATMDQG